MKHLLLTTIAAVVLSGTAFNRLHAHEPPPAFRMACIFTDHMVLQRDQPLPVWGWAAPGRVVTVEVGPHSAPHPLERGRALALHPGAGHFVHHDKPSLVSRTLKMWLLRDR